MKLKTPIGYYGGKQKMAPKIIRLFPPHVQYVEPFLGGAAVFFMKGRSTNEVINDLDGRVTNFYRCMKHPVKFEVLKIMIHGTPHSEMDHTRAAQILKEEIESTDVERAWAFWVQTNMSFSKMIYGGFAFGEGGQITKALQRKRENFTDKYMKRLERVEIFSRDACDLIKLKDSVNTLFYCDPPYVSSDCGHYEGYTMDDFKNLLDTLAEIEGKFLLSSYPEDLLMEYREKHNWNSNDEIRQLCVTGKREEAKFKTECITMNYDLAPTLFHI